LVVGKSERDVQWHSLEPVIEWVLPVVLLVLWFSPTDWIIGRFFKNSEDPIMQLGISQLERKVTRPEAKS
jgi:hypothetical protein